MASVAEPMVEAWRGIKPSISVTDFGVEKWAHQQVPRPREGLQPRPTLSARQPWRSIADWLASGRLTEQLFNLLVDINSRLTSFVLIEAQLRAFEHSPVEDGCLRAREPLLGNPTITPRGREDLSGH